MSCDKDFTKSFPGPFIDGCDLLTTGAARASALPTDATPLENEPAFASKVIRVAANGNSTVSGTSWNSTTTLEHALEIADEDTEIWIKAGTHRGSIVSSTQLASFLVNKGLRIFGGFAGTEKTRNQKNPVTNVTILSGKLDARIADHVMQFEGDGIGDVFISGLTIQEGGVGTVATGDYYAFEEQGGGVLILVSNANITFKDCIIQDNNARQRGGNICIYSDNVPTAVTDLNLTFRDCTIRRGVVPAGGAGDGAGIFCLMDGTSSITMVNTIMENNVASDDGCAIRSDGLPLLTCVNCIFVGNNGASSNTGLIQSLDPITVCKMYNCTFTGNTVTSSIMSGGTNGSLAYNCIAWDNSITTFANAAWTMVNCNFRGGLSAVTGALYNNIIDADPQFVQNWDAGTKTFDVHLKNSSPSLNRGDNNLVSSLSSTDIEGNVRIQNDVVDQGAYESSNLLVGVEIATATGSGDDVNPSPAVNTTYINTLNDGVDYANAATGTLYGGVDDGKIRYIKANVLDFDGVATRTPYELDCTKSSVVNSMDAPVHDIVFDANNEQVVLVWSTTDQKWTITSATATVNLDLG